MTINTVDIISKYTKLKKLGPSYTGICPFCGATGITDFIVSLQHQKYTCDKCGATGGIFQFLLSLKRVSLEEALSEVKKTFNISFDADFWDSRWNEYLQDTDFQHVLRKEAEKVTTFFKTGDSRKEGRAIVREPVSYTALATFIRCPLEYKLRYRDKANIYEPVGTHVNVGRFLHSVATQFLKLPIDQRNEQFVESQFQQETGENRNPEYINELRRFEGPTITLLLQNFVDKSKLTKNLHFKTEFGSFAIVGTADCLIESRDGTEIIEFKEYDYREFGSDLQIVHYLQLLFYFFGLGGRDAGISSGSYCFFNNSYVDRVVFSGEMVSQGGTFIEAKLRELSNCKDFIPKLNSLCISCGYKDKCELHRTGKPKVVA